jgi:hypothetical protein
VSLFKQVLHCFDLPFFQSVTTFFVGTTLISFIHMSVSNLHFFGKGMTQPQGYGSITNHESQHPASQYGIPYYNVIWYTISHVDFFFLNLKEAWQYRR